MSTIIERQFSSDAFDDLVPIVFPIKAVTREFDLALMRLATNQSTQYGEIDRLMSESDFRTAISPPIGFLIVGLLGDVPVGIEIAAALVVPLLVIDATYLRRRANDRLASAIHLGYTNVPLLEQAATDGRRRAEKRGTFMTVEWLIGFLKMYGYSRDADEVSRELALRLPAELSSGGRAFDPAKAELKLRMEDRPQDSPAN